MPYVPWEQYWNFQRSREELRMMDYHRRQQEAYRYGSNGTLSNSQCDLYNGGNGGCYPPRYPPYSQCYCDPRSMMGSNGGSGCGLINDHDHRNNCHQVGKYPHLSLINTNFPFNNFNNI